MVGALNAINLDRSWHEFNGKKELMKCLMKMIAYGRHRLNMLFFLGCVRKEAHRVFHSTREKRMLTNHKKVISISTIKRNVARMRKRTSHRINSSTKIKTQNFQSTNIRAPQLNIFRANNKEHRLKIRENVRIRVNEYFSLGIKPFLS